jgi:dTDP-4-amino-4,6-dideoxygalactose transaminase
MFVHPQLKLNIKNLLLFFKPVSEQRLKDKLSKFFPDKNIVFTDSGRSAFQLAIKHLNLQNSEMLVPAYICDIFLPIFKQYSIKPIFLDIEPKTFNIQISEIEKKITTETKSILVCHTYGLLNDMDKISDIAKQHNLKIIEDCAHLSFGSLPRASEASRGDCAFLSLPKFLPVVNGGILACRNMPFTKLKNCAPKLSDLRKFFRLFPSLAAFSEKFRHSYEKNNKSIISFTRNNKFNEPTKPFECSLRILNWYLNNLEGQISKRAELAEYFHKKLRKIGFQSAGITYISALVSKNINRDELFYKLRKKNIFCGRIWHKPIYLLPNTNETAKRIINFPFQNWFERKDIDRIINGILSSIG